MVKIAHAADASTAIDSYARWFIAIVLQPLLNGLKIGNVGQEPRSDGSCGLVFKDQNHPLCLWHATEEMGSYGNPHLSEKVHFQSRAPS